MFYGVAGMFAHIFLIGFLIRTNLRRKAELVWPLFYVALIFQMLFDAAFSGVRFYGLFFMLVGVNLQYLRQRRTTHVSPHVHLQMQYLNR